MADEIESWSWFQYIDDIVTIVLNYVFITQKILAVIIIIMTISARSYKGKKSAFLLDIYVCIHIYNSYACSCFKWNAFVSIYIFNMC